MEFLIRLYYSPHCGTLNIFFATLWKIVYCNIAILENFQKLFLHCGKLTFPILEEVICRINLANSDLFAGLIWQIVAYLPDLSGK